MHKSKPLSFEELPKICQQYFTRAMRVTKKQAIKHRSNATTQKYLRQILPAADVGQRERMCQIAMDTFAEKNKKLELRIKTSVLALATFDFIKRPSETLDCFRRPTYKNPLLFKKRPQNPLYALHCNQGFPAFLSCGATHHSAQNVRGYGFAIVIACKALPNK